MEAEDILGVWDATKDILASGEDGEAAGCRLQAGLGMESKSHAEKDEKGCLWLLKGSRE